MPYIDDTQAITDAGDFFVIADSGIDAGETSGLLGSVWRCEHCGDAADGNESYWIDGVDERWCSDCAENNAYQSVQGDWFSSTDDLTLLHGGDYDEEYSEEYGLSRWPLAGSYVQIEAGSHEGEFWHTDHIFTCDHCGATYHTDDRSGHEDLTDRDVCDGCEAELLANPDGEPETKAA